MRKLLLIPIMVLFASIFAQAQTAKICVISDIHYFDPDLLINDGSAFQTYLAMDRKLLKESEAILESIVDTILSIDPDILLVPGDLTKDAEKTGHEKVAAYFQQLEDAGIEVIVCPGNHDVNNPHAVSYDFDQMIPVPTVRANQFDSIYANFGYNQAIEKDPNSLSFIIEPIAGLQILSMDVCKYQENGTTGHPETSGGFTPETYAWVKSKIQDAVSNNKIILGMQHHGMLEHYQGQKSMFPEYVIDDYDSVSSELADLGLKIVFTGHYHAQDMVKKVTENGNVIYDIETGSTVTYPCPYRVIELTEDTTLIVTGDSIQEIDYELGGVQFNQYARNYIETGLPLLVNYMLTSPPYSLDSATAAQIEPAITESFIAHYKGNEGTPSAQTQAIIDMLLTSPDPTIGYALMAIWNDPQPDDWQIEIDLNETHVGVANNIAISQVKLFPNPAKDYINVLVPNNKQQEINIALYDNKGKKVVDKSDITNNIAISINHLPKGVYVVKVKVADTILSKKLLVL